jgi:hypothetical protein
VAARFARTPTRGLKPACCRLSAVRTTPGALQQVSNVGYESNDVLSVDFNGASGHVSFDAMLARKEGVLQFVNFDGSEWHVLSDYELLQDGSNKFTILKNQSMNPFEWRREAVVWAGDPDALGEAIIEPPASECVCVFWLNSADVTACKWSEGPVVTLVFLILLIICCCTAIAIPFYHQWIQDQEDLIWSVKPEELVFQEPVEILGRGTFGFVLKAEYRGTTVAVKRVLPPKTPLSRGKKSRGKKSQDSTEQADSREGEVQRIQTFGGGDIVMWLSQARQAAAVRRDAPSSDEEGGSGTFSAAQLSSGMEPPGQLDTNGEFVSGRATGQNEDAAISVDIGYGLGSPRGADDSIHSGFADMHKEESDSRQEVALSLLSRAESRDVAPSIIGTVVSGLNSQVFLGSKAKSGIASRGGYENLQRMFLQEMRMLAKLRHPCIVQVMGAVMKRGTEPMLVMECMDHGSLYDLLHNETVELDAEVSLPILRDIARGLRFLHAADPCIVHGDLKAQNVRAPVRWPAPRARGPQRGPARGAPALTGRAAGAGRLKVQRQGCGLWADAEAPARGGRDALLDGARAAGRRGQHARERRVLVWHLAVGGLHRA